MADRRGPRRRTVSDLEHPGSWRRCARWTCLVLCLGVVQSQDLGAQKPEDFDEKVSRALDRARPLLLDKLSTLQQGRLALACHALLNDGVTMKDQRLAAAILRLSRQELFQGYALSLRLMIMQELSDYPGRKDAARKDCEELLRRQRRDGSFSYSPGQGRGDLSNTQYAALGLRAAHHLGVDIARKRWERLASYAMHQQGKDGGGHYSGRGRNASESMTVALIAVLEICNARLDAPGRTNRRRKKAIQDAWRWMEKRGGRVASSGPISMHNYYYHYGLERAAILSGVFDIAGVDWYVEGAKMMLAHQSSWGGWGSVSMAAGSRVERAARGRIDEVVTSFAILFLRRRFQRTLGTVTTAGSWVRAHFLPEHASKAQIEASVQGEVARGYKSVPGLLKALRSQFTSRRRAGVRALVKITGRFEELSPYRRPEENEELLDQIESWWMREGRKHLDR